MSPLPGSVSGMATNTQNAQSLAPIQPTPIETIHQVNALVPTSIDGAMQFAQWLAKSSLLPKNVNKEHDIFFIICAGMELGLPPMAALRGLYTVHGRTALESKTKAALCLQKGAALYFKRLSYNENETVWETMRHGQTEPVRSRFTLLEAQEAGLAPDRKNNRPGKEGPWRQYTQRMISHRALGWLCDDVYPDIVMGVATAEDFDPQEFTFKPIGAGVELATPTAVPAIAAAAEVVPGTPKTAKNANTPKTATAPAPDSAPTQTQQAQPTQEFPKDTSKQGDSTPAGSKKPEPTGAPLTDDEMADVIERTGKFSNEKELKAYYEENVRNRQMTDVQRNKLLNIYGDQVDMIRDAAKQEKAGQ